MMPGTALSIAVCMALFPTSPSTTCSLPLCRMKRIFGISRFLLLDGSKRIRTDEAHFYFARHVVAADLTRKQRLHFDRFGHVVDPRDFVVAHSHFMHGRGHALTGLRAAEAILRALDHEHRRLRPGGPFDSKVPGPLEGRV